MSPTVRRGQLSMWRREEEEGVCDQERPYGLTHTHTHAHPACREATRWRDLAHRQTCRARAVLTVYFPQTSLATHIHLSHNKSEDRKRV